MFQRAAALAALVAALALTATPARVQERTIRTIDLDYSPQISPDARSGALLEQPIVLRLTDHRSGDLAWVGTETKIDGSTTGLRVANDVLPLVIRAMHKSASEFAVIEDRESNLVLQGRLLVLNGMVQQRGDGALYIANIRVAFDLHSRAGEPLWSGIASGDTSEFGPRFDIGPFNHAVSNALVDAFEDLFGDAGLCAIWNGTAEPQATPDRDDRNSIAPPEVPEWIRTMQSEGLEVDAMIARIGTELILAAPPDVFEIAAWKSGGIPERVIRAILDRPVANRSAIESVR